LANVLDVIGGGISGLAKDAAAGIFSGIADVIAKFKADPTVSAQIAAKLNELEIELQKAQLQAEVALSEAQNRVNAAEAASGDKFASRWRPSIGWICAFGLSYTFIIQPLLVWGSLNWKIAVPPLLNTDSLMTLLFGMLGLGAQRSYDKMKGTVK
jgi:hypothetical protein